MRKPAAAKMLMVKVAGNDNDSAGVDAAITL